MKIDYRALPLDKVLWVVYGPDSFPSLLCCKITDKGKGPQIWGFSVRKREPGFRTLGWALDMWIERQKESPGTMPEFYDDHEEALDRLRKLTSPMGLE